MKYLFASLITFTLLWFSIPLYAQDEPQADSQPDESQIQSSPEVPAETSVQKDPSEASPLDIQENDSIKPSIDTLFNQIQTLQDEVNRLKEEAEVRKSLEMTQEEKTEKEQEILSAAGRQYTLLRKGILSVEDNVRYSFSSTDAVSEWGMVEHKSNHSIENALSFEYALLDNLTVNLSLPLVYKNDKNSTTESLSVNDIGDISVGGQWQPIKSGGDLPAPIFYGNLVVPSGRSPFKIVMDEDLSTGNGFYSLSVGMSVNKSLDPIVAFSNVSLSYNHTVRKLNQRYASLILTKIQPGESIGFSTGIGYAFSYQVSMFMSFQYSYQFNSRYYWKNNARTSSGSSVNAMFNMGTRWNLSPKRSVTTQLGIGLTNSAQDFVLSVRIPFEFDIASDKKS
ncbi:MAG: transporter [Candidatus Magnetomorum sp.]|nr:transporter [Candidatus Magnetomorum sp.]